MVLENGTAAARVLTVGAVCCIVIEWSSVSLALVNYLPMPLNDQQISGAQEWESISPMVVLKHADRATAISQEIIGPELEVMRCRTFSESKSAWILLVLR